MVVVYKTGLFFKIKNKKAFILSVVLLTLSLGAFLAIYSINNRTVSVKEHADTKLSPTIAEYKASTKCEGQNFVVKYKIVIKTPPVEQGGSVTYALQAFFPSVVERSWITYVSGGGEILGSSAIKWSGIIKANETKEFFYTLTIPGGKLRPGANFKNVAVLASSSGFKEQKDVSVVIDSCGAIATNPILPSPTDTPIATSTPSPVNSSSAGGQNTQDNEQGDTTGLLGAYLENANNTNSSSASTNFSGTSTNSSETYNQGSSSESPSNNTTAEDTNENTNNAAYYNNSDTANPPSGVQLEANNINTGVFDSPITAMILLISGIVIKIVIKKSPCEEAVVEVMEQ